MSEEDAVPARAARRDVVDVENHAGKTLVENAGLNLKRDLGSEQGAFNGAEGAKAERGQPESHHESKSRAKHGKNPNRKKNALAADAESGKSDDFAVHGHAAKAEQDANEDGHGDGEDENAGDDEEEEVNDLGARAGVADEELHETNELGNEQNKGKNDEAEESVANNFANDVTIEDAHVEKGECNMGEGFATEARRAQRG